MTLMDQLRAISQLRGWKLDVFTFDSGQRATVTGPHWRVSVAHEWGDPGSLAERLARRLEELGYMED